MNSLTSTSFTAFIGIDWADTKHDVCLQASNNDKREFAVIPYQVDRIEQWAHAVHKRFGGTVISPFLAASRSSIQATIANF